MFTFTHILGIKITTNDKKDIIDYIVKYLDRKTAKPLTIFTPNPEQIIQAQQNFHFGDILNSGDINLPDGRGLVWAMRRIGYPKLGYKEFQKIAGIDFMEDLLHIAAEKGHRVAFLGGRNRSAVEAFKNLKNKYPGLAGWGKEVPELKFKKIDAEEKSSQNIFKSLIINHQSPTETEHYFRNLAKQIITDDIRLVFVGLGAPKQEFFIQNLKSHIRKYQSPLILMSVGGAFDILAGKLPRVPAFMKNLEFLWRLVLEPQRFFRQLRLVKFVYLVLRQQFVVK